MDLHGIDTHNPVQCLIWILSIIQHSEAMPILTHFILETPQGVLAKSADPNQMPHDVAFDLGLHYLASFSDISQQKYHNVHNLTPLSLENGLFQYILQKSSFSMKWVKQVCILS